MSQFGDAAVLAVRKVRSGEIRSPREAWTYAVGKVCDKRSMRDKVCPRSAFLGLCETGMVNGVASGNYIRAKLGRKLNKEYAVDAVARIQVDPSLVDDELKLWLEVMDGESKPPNEQMDVVIALWKNGLLRP